MKKPSRLSQENESISNRPQHLDTAKCEIFTKNNISAPLPLQTNKTKHCKQKSPSAYLITRPRIIVQTKESIARKNNKCRQNKKTKLFSLSTQVFSALPHFRCIFFFYNFLISESVSQGHEYGHRAAGQSQFSILGWQIPLLPPESTSHIKLWKKRYYRTRDIFYICHKFCCTRA